MTDPAVPADAAPTAGRAAPDVATPAARDRYLAAIDERLRFAGAATWLRASGMQLMWLVVIVAGAGVPLNLALGGPSWVEPTCGFVVVVGAGIERVFGRTTVAAVARDRLRRDLARERRRFELGHGEYADPATAFSRFVDRCEAVFERYDEEMLAHQQAVVV